MLKNLEFSLERPRSEDTETLSRLYSQVFMATYPNEEAGITREWCARYAARMVSPPSLGQSIVAGLRNPDKFSLLAWTDAGRLVGSIEGYSASDTHYQTLQALYTDPSVHGHGVGPALAETFLEWIDSRDFRQPVELEVVAYNERAIRFYDRYGFQLLPAQQRLIGGVLPVVRMERPA